MLLTACTSNKSKKTTVSTDYLHVIDLSKTAPTVPLSEVFASIQPVILETTNESLIGMISEVVVTPEYLIVHDRIQANALFLFKKDGTFLHKFGRIGGGPGEYFHISNFCYDNTTSTLYVFDGSAKRVNLYNIHTGSFLKSITLQNDKGYSSYIYYQNGELYSDLQHFTSENEQYLLNKRNQTTGEIEESSLDLKTYSKNIDYIKRNPFLFGDGKSFKFNTTLMDGIVSVEKGKITPFLTFNPESLLSMDDLKGLSPHDPNRDNFSFYIGDPISSQAAKLTKSNQHKLFGINHYFEYKDLIYMNFWLGGIMPKTLLYDKKTKDSKYLVMHEDDLMYKNNSVQHLAAFIAHDDNGLYAIHQDSRRLKALLEKDLISENFKSVAIKLANLEDDANPFLLYYEFKE